MERPPLPPLNSPPPARARAGVLLRTLCSMLLCLSAYQWVKHLLLPHQTLGQSNIITVVFGSVLATGVTARALRERQQWQNTEDARRQSERRKAAILSGALDCIITIDQHGRVLEWNPAAERTFGYSADEAQGQSLSDLIIPPAFQARHEEGMARYAATGEDPALGKRIEVTALRRNGEEFDTELTVVPIAEGDATVLTFFLRDISERKRAEGLLHAQEEQYRLLFENATHGIYRTTPDGRIVLANPALLEMLGFDSFAQLAARNLEIEGTEADYARADFKAQLEAAGALRGLETAWTRRDGQTICVRENAQVVRDAEGRVLFYDGSVEDITARKDAEEALRRSEARFQRNAANAPGMMYQFVLRPDGSVAFPFVSDGCREIYGLEPAEIMADPMSIISIIHPDDQAGFQESVAQSAHTLTPWHWEGRFILPSGARRWVQGASRPERQTNGNIAWDGLLMDVTARKVAQEALQDAHEDLMHAHDRLEDRVLERTAALAAANAALQQENEERRQAQDALRDSEQRYRLLVDLCPEAIVVYSDSRLVYVNTTALRLLGAERPEQLLGRSIMDFVHPDYHALVRERARRSQQEGLASELTQHQYVRLDGQVIDIESVSTPITFGGQPAGQVIARDITARRRSEREIADLNAELTHAYDATIEGWSRALDLRDKETEGHCQRVTDMTLRLARALGLPEEDLVHIRRGALLHDIGKMGVPDAILLKPGPLTDDEWLVMRRHPTHAYEMLCPVEFLRPALDIPRFHHEKWDGTGYPLGLAGDGIPLAARIFAVVDVWDALRSDRPYRAGWPPARVHDHIHALRGTHFDPQVVDAFLPLICADASPTPSLLLQAA